MLRSFVSPAPRVRFRLRAQVRAYLVAILALLCGTGVLQNAVANGDTRTLYMQNMNTGESGAFTFKREGRYDQDVLKQLNWFLRDWRRSEPTRMDPQLFDLVWEVYREVGASEPIHVLSGYRSPETNAMLRTRSRLVAEQSQHMRGRAMDFFIPGVSITQLRVVGLRMQRGGVGFYPTANSPFVHMDTGSVRHWPRMTHDQLVRVFPDEKTVHIPSDGKPLANYKVALAELEARGGTAGGVEDEEDFGSGLKNFFAALFGGGKSSAPAGSQDMSVSDVRVAARSAAKNGEGGEDGGARVASAGPVQAAYVSNGVDDTAPEAASAPTTSRSDGARAAVPLPVRAPEPKVATVALASAPRPVARPAELAAAFVTAQATLAPLPDVPLPPRRPVRGSTDQIALNPPLPAVITRGDAGSREMALAFAPSNDLMGENSGAILSPTLQPVAAPTPLPSRSRQRAKTSTEAAVNEAPMRRMFQSQSVAGDPALRAPEGKVLTAFVGLPRDVVVSSFSSDATAGLSTSRFSGPAVAAVPVYSFAPVQLTERLQ